MRFLLVTAPAQGHFFPLVPLADALAQAGHAVAFASTDDFIASVRAVGHDAVSFGPTRDVIPPDVLDEHALAALLDAARAWSPDVIVHDHVVAATGLVADALGIPNAYSSVGIMRTARMMSWLSERSRPLWQRQGREVPEDLGLHRYLYLDRCPASLNRTEIAGVEVAHPIRPSSWEGAPPPDLSEWLDVRGERPLVYVTLGTFFNSRDGITGIVRALDAEDLDLIVTVGMDVDPADVPLRSANVER